MNFLRVFSVVPIILLIVEIWLLRHPSAPLVWWIGAGAWFVVVLCFLVLTRRKDRKTRKRGLGFFRRAFLLVLAGSASSINGVVMVLYMLLHVGWITDDLRDYYSENLGIDTLAQPFLYVAFLLLPFLLLALLNTYFKSAVRKEIQRRVLITGVSKMGAFDVIEQKKYESVEARMAAVKPESNWQSWDPIRHAMEKYRGSLQEVVLLQTEEVVNQEAQFAANPATEGRTLTALIKQQFEKIHINYFPLKEHADVERIYSKLDELINEELAERYEDGEMLLAITSGTSSLSAALGLHSVKGKRAMVYTAQGTPGDLREFDVDIETVEELWDSIVDKNLGH